MRILHTTDFHFRKEWFDWLTGRAKDFDICCLSGDLLDLRHREKLNPTVQALWVGKWLAAFPGRLCVCSGNHDWRAKDDDVVDGKAEAAWLRRRSRPGLLVDGEAEVLDGYRFACKPWAGPFHVRLDRPMVLLAHEPQDGTAVSADVVSKVGNFAMNVLISHLPSKSIVLSGHIHHPRRWNDIEGDIACFNPGFAVDQSVPNHIVIDLKLREAELFGWGRLLGPIRF